MNHSQSLILVVFKKQNKFLYHLLYGLFTDNFIETGGAKAISKALMANTTLAQLYFWCKSQERKETEISLFRLYLLFTVFMKHREFHW